MGGAPMALRHARSSRARQGRAPTQPRFARRELHSAVLLPSSPPPCLFFSSQRRKPGDAWGERREITRRACEILATYRKVQPDSSSCRAEASGLADVSGRHMRLPARREHRRPRCRTFRRHRSDIRTGASGSKDPEEFACRPRNLRPEGVRESLSLCSSDLI
jgi:hypothetical protein